MCHISIMQLYAANGLGEGLKINGSFLIDLVATSGRSHVWSAQWPVLLFPSVNWRMRVGEACMKPIPTSDRTVPSWTAQVKPNGPEWTAQKLQASAYLVQALKEKGWVKAEFDDEIPL